MKTTFPLDQNGVAVLEVSGRGSGPYNCALNGKTCHRATLSELKSGLHLELSNGSVVDVQRAGLLQPIYARRDGVALPTNGLAQMSRARVLAFVWGVLISISGGYVLYDFFWRGGTIEWLWKARTASQIVDYGLILTGVGVLCFAAGFMSWQRPRFAFSVLGCYFLLNGLVLVAGWLHYSAFLFFVLAMPSLISAGVFFRALGNARSLRKLPKETAILAAVKLSA
jgi:hypothetical protein